MSAPVQVPDDIVERIRAFCLALPEVTVRVDESLSPKRSTAWSYDIRHRSFCLFIAVANKDGGPVPLLVLRASPDERDALLAHGPPYFPARAGRDRVTVVLTRKTDWAEIRELITESYRTLAPKKLTALLDQHAPNTQARSQGSPNPVDGPSTGPGHHGWSIHGPNCNSANDPSPNGSCST